MGLQERAVIETRDAARREADLQRWADDGGFIPEAKANRPQAVLTAVVRNPWAAVGIAAGIGFVFGWLTGRSSRE
jgi:ElaB/YqjD/DUF883 family membrane-anchored ribosome-binding protein